MKLVLVFPILRALVQNFNRFSNIVCNHVIALLQLSETLNKEKKTIKKIESNLFNIIHLYKVETIFL